MRLETITYYRLPRDEDGRHPRGAEVQRPFEMALRWQPDMPVPDDMVSSASKRKGEAPVHAGASALHTLAEGGEIAGRLLDAGVAWLRDAIAYYGSPLWEPYPGRNDEAIADLRALLDELTGDNDDCPECGGFDTYTAAGDCPTCHGRGGRNPVDPGIL